MPRGAREEAAWQAGADTLGSPLRALPAESALAWAPVARQNGETWVGFGLLGSAVWAVRAQALTHARTHGLGVGLWARLSWQQPFAPAGARAAGAVRRLVRA